MAKRKLNVAMIGYDFMGRAHSNAWRQVGAVLPGPAVRAGAEGGRRPDRGEGEGGGRAPRLRGARRRAGRRCSRARTSTSSTSARRATRTPRSPSPPPRRARRSSARSRSRTRVADAERMHAAAKKAGVVNMVCHNYRRCPAVALAKQIIDEGQIGDIHHYRGLYLQDWIVDPKFPRVWRLEKARAGSGSLGDILSHTMDLSRHLVGEPVEVSGLLKTFITERPLPEDREPARQGRRRRCGAGAGEVRERRGRLLRGLALRARAQELQPLRDQRLEGEHRVGPRADERARALHRVGAAERLPHHLGHRRQAPVRRRPGGRPATSSATSTRSRTPSTTS